MSPRAVSPLVDLAEVAGRFGHLLHAAGLPVTPERAGRFAGALALVAPADLDALYWSARVTLVSDRRQLDVFDRVFAQVFRGRVDPADVRGDPSAPPPAHVRAGDHLPPVPSQGAAPSAGEPSGAGADPGAEPEGEPTPEAALAAMSTEERLRHRDFAALTPEELAGIRRLLRGLSLAPPPRRARRLVRDRRGRHVDLRATLGRAHRTGGDPVVTVRRRHRTRPRRLVLLCDISGSMEPYARAYLQLLHSAVAGAGAEAFVFGTRLTRVTGPLRSRRPDDALRRASARAPDWSGGTRIGAALRTFTDAHGRRGMARGAVIVIVSDGWERDDPELLGREMRRLALLAHRIVWVNPRRASPHYAPLVAGMAAALPSVDAFVSGHSVAAMDEVVWAIAAAPRRTPASEPSGTPADPP